MQNRSVTKLRVEVNLLSEFINKPKPPGVTAKEILERVNDIHERLKCLNDYLRDAHAHHNHAVRMSDTEWNLQEFRQQRNAQMGDAVRERLNGNP